MSETLENNVISNMEKVCSTQVKYSESRMAYLLIAKSLAKTIDDRKSIERNWLYTNFYISVSYIIQCLLLSLPESITTYRIIYVMEPHSSKDHHMSHIKLMFADKTIVCRDESIYIEDNQRIIKLDLVNNIKLHCDEKTDLLILPYDNRNHFDKRYYELCHMRYRPLCTWVCSRITTPLIICNSYRCIQGEVRVKSYKH